MDEREIRLGCLQVAATIWSQVPARNGLPTGDLDALKGWALDLERFVSEMEPGAVIQARIVERQQAHMRAMSEQSRLMREAFERPARDRAPTCAEAMRDR